MSIINWHKINTVFLDMDGTLLDLHFDNHFWLKHLPQRYAEQYELSLDIAKATLFNRYKAMLGKLEWYCVDYWSKQLNMDIIKLKEEVAHLIAIHPDVIPFLSALRQYNKRIVLLTNAHHKSLSLKMQRTKIAQHFDRIISAHSIGLPKEQIEFWQKLQTIEAFKPAETLLIDDSLPVLRSATHYGINSVGIYQPDSQLPPKEMAEFQTIRNFKNIMPHTHGKK
jgi:putative hydrolase of the HAD superfamily